MQHNPYKRPFLGSTLRKRLHSQTPALPRFIITFSKRNNIPPNINSILNNDSNFLRIKFNYLSAKWYKNDEEVPKHLQNQLKNILEINIKAEMRLGNIYSKSSKLNFQLIKQTLIEFYPLKDILLILSHLNKWCYELSKVIIQQIFRSCTHKKELFNKLAVNYKKQVLLAKSLTKQIKSYDLKSLNKSIQNLDTVKQHILLSKQHVSKLEKEKALFRKLGTKHPIKLLKTFKTYTNTLCFYRQYSIDQPFLKDLFHGLTLAQIRKHLLESMHYKFGISFINNDILINNTITRNNIDDILRILNTNYIKNKLKLPENYTFVDKILYWRQYEMVLYQIMLFICYQKKQAIENGVLISDIKKEAKQRKLEYFGYRLYEYTKISICNSFMALHKKIFCLPKSFILGNID